MSQVLKHSLTGGVSEPWAGSSASNSQHIGMPLSSRMGEAPHPGFGGTHVYDYLLKNSSTSSLNTFVP